MTRYTDLDALERELIDALALDDDACTTAELAAAVELPALAVYRALAALAARTGTVALHPGGAANDHEHCWTITPVGEDAFRSALEHREEELDA